MTISIITVTFNSASTVRCTFESILSQTYTDIDYIVVDGGSQDGTTEIIKEYEPRFGGRMHWISERDRGIYDAMNKGINMAKGDIIGILNSDDMFEDNSVLEDIAHTFTNTQTDAVFGNLVFVKEDDTNAIVRTWEGSEYKSGAFLKGWHPAHPTFYVRKEIYDRYGNFDISFEVSADFELMLRFIEKERIRTQYINRYIVRMRIGGESTGSIAKIIKGNKNVLKAFKKNGLKPLPFYLVRRLLPKAINILKNR